ncbi:ABC transporter permease [Vibrio penaeicida]|uniref:ABC transporter permease n=1 Tax=Vibrio penaeicida TaxID=104609 RepID=UPI000CEA1CA8|nr:ABC transporter permease [Vibrio penaeicida]
MKTELINSSGMTHKTENKGLLALISRFAGAREAALVAIIVILFVVMSFASPYFLTWANMRAMLLSFSTEGLVVVGMTILLIVGGFDLSVGAVMCLSMVIAGKLFLLGMDPWVASLVAIAACAGIGSIMGVCVTKVGLSHFMTTLAFLGIARGLCFVITEGSPLSLYSLPPEFKFIGQGDVFGLPFSVIIFIAVIFLSDYMLRNMLMFRRVYYTGSNEKAALYSGIRTDRIKFWTTVLCSSMAGLAGIIFMSKFGGATPTFGVGLELNVIAAAVIGGASLNGGAGTIFGAILGIALLSIVSSSLILLNVPVYWQELIRGLILLSAIAIDHVIQSKK